MEFKNKFFAWIAVLLIQALAGAQTIEPVTLTIKQCENLFFENNFMLLAQQYNIGIADAQVIQARVYPNPEITADVIAYEQQNNNYFPMGRQGNFVAGIEQLIILGGKRRKAIEMAALDKKIAEAELTDVTRNLRRQIWDSFYTLHHKQKLIEKYDLLLERLSGLIVSYTVQVAKSNIALKDLVRLKAVYVKINNDKSEESLVLIEEQQKLNTLLGITAVIKTVYPQQEAGLYSNKALLYEDVVQKAEQNRPDLTQALLSTQSATLNLSLQRKMQIPDITLRAGYNQQGDAYINQYNIGLAIPLPIFDRNKGNIKAAQINKDLQDTNVKYRQLEIKNEVLAAWQDYVRSTEEYKRITLFINDDFDTVYNGITSNFRKGNISMIEFADFFESYNEAQAEAERVKKQLALAAARIDYVTGTTNF